jgi:small basic protein (TIGR04137 family)
MTIHRSLKTKSGALSQHRSVLTRAERITKLSAQEKYAPGGQSPLGLVKVSNLVVGGKKKKAATEDKAATPAAGGKAAGAKAAAPAAGAKAAAPAAGAKAPAGKK